MTVAVQPPTARGEPDWAEIRAGYPGALRRAYLDNACKGIPSARAVEAIAAHCAFLRECPGDSTTADTLVAREQLERARRAAAALVHAEPDEIALVQSTQDGLNALADALDLRGGDVVLVPDLEFVGTVMPWRSLERHGVEVRLVAHREGRVELADLEAALDERTRVIVASSVQEVNGFVLDVDGLAALCRRHGVVSVIDGIQHVGPLPFDVRRTPVDALAVGGHKWLCAPFGMGFLYVARRLHDGLTPTIPGYMTTEPPEGEWLTYLEDPERLPTDEMRLARDARKLELGAIGSSLPAAGLAAAIETLLEIGLEAIAARVERLLALAADALEDAGARIVTPDDGRGRAFLAFRAGATVDDERRLVARLAAEGVAVSLRFTTGVGGIRVAPYFYSDESDVERLAAAVRAARRGA
jgi:selenocysteine lyase/cysteine desulfurase